MRATLIAPPEGYDATREVETASRALRYLLIANPNQVITHRDVCEMLGRDVSRGAVCNAAAKMRRGSFGMPIYSRVGLGYVLLVPVPAQGRKRCEACPSRSLIGTCRRLKGRPVEDGETCYAWGLA